MQNNFKLFWEEINKFSFSQMSPRTIKKFLHDNGFPELNYLVDKTYQQTKINFQNFVYGELRCIICNNIIDRSTRRKKVCSDICHNKQRSKFQTENNSSHKMSPATKLATKQKLSNIMKQKILNGEFTPKSENYKTHGTINFTHNGEIRKVRSLWELIYWLLYPNLQFETIRIPYYDSFQEKTRIYIPDFYDSTTNTIFEIKPKKYQFTLKDKKLATIEQGYTYIILDEEFFNKNLKTLNLLEQINACVLNADDIKNRLKWLKK